MFKLEAQAKWGLDPTCNTMELQDKWGSPQKIRIQNMPLNKKGSPKR